MAAVYQKKGIDKDSMTNEEYDEFLKSSMPRDYDDMKAEFEEFKKGVEKNAEENGVKIVSKKDLDKYPGMYAISLRDALNLSSNISHKKCGRKVKFGRKEER